ncbi:sensor histidine kinase [Fredinandcohnia sp. QZ13]|uniref:sensor histidine kinase n=1 Tax=Fredinandcohnia sp. QZ13 TaxID=3073144 RepID=UPI0028531934|nr:sensor histidine kinase [Fredinandcohnia sp. QZ13]MDR4887155.1 sensor histidine kinase [Fredinandcohnia sp. QZ13]
MLKLFNITLQTKIITLILTLIVFVISVLTGMFLYYEAKDTNEEMQKLAIQASRTLSLIPIMKDVSHEDVQSGSMQAITQQIGNQAGANYVLIEYKDGLNISYPSYEVGHSAFDPENYKAIVFGGYYTIETKNELGHILWGKAPIFAENNGQQIIGVASVGFLKNEIQQSMNHKLLKTLIIAIIVLIVGIFGGVLLAKSIRNDIMGLEPHEIASLYRERNAILKSVKEGIIAIDNKGFITLLNNSAKQMLGISNESINKPIAEILPNTRMLRVLDSNMVESDDEMIINNRVLIVNRMPIIENGKTVGVVSSFRDKTEIKKMVDTLTEIKNYSEDLRAQTHEFTNKLYVLSGLLQLQQYEQAIAMIQQETNQLNFQNDILFNQIKDPKLQAILLGKIGRASEKKVSLEIDENSYLTELPGHISITDCIIIIGNLIDNAIDEVMQDEGIVTFFVTDIGNDIVFEVSDNGKGIPNDKISKLFEKGVSSKAEKNRGFGLWNVKTVVDKLSGSIEVTNGKNNGAIFTVFLPIKNQIDKEVD